MDWFARAFVKASLCWLALGVTLGVAMAVHPPWTVHRPAHQHMNLLGFVTMMIYGVAYHVLPRFTGHPLHSKRLAGWHWWASNVGLALMVAGFAWRATTGTHGGALLAAGGRARAGLDGHAAAGGDARRPHALTGGASSVARQRFPARDSGKPAQMPAARPDGRETAHPHD